MQSSNVSADIAAIVAIMAQANVAIPVILGTVTSVISIIQALGGTPPPLEDVIKNIESQVAANRIRGDVEIARLKELLAEGK